MIPRVALAALTLVACAPSAAAPPPVESGCADVVATGDAEADVAMLADRCAHGLRPVHGEVSGSQGQGDPSVRLALVARGDRRCFRVVAAGGVGVTELDVQVIAPDGRPLARDTRHGALAVVPDDALLCLPEGGSYTVEIAVTQGSGTFVARAFTGS